MVPAISFQRYKIMHSLQFRLLVAFTLVIVVTIGSVFFFVYQSTKTEVNRFGERFELMRTHRIEKELSNYYYRQGGWEGIQPYVEQWGNLYERRIILTDDKGIVLADSQGELLGALYESDLSGISISTPWETQALGVLYMSPPLLPERNFPSFNVIYGTVGRFLLWGGAGGNCFCPVIHLFPVAPNLSPG